MITNDKLEELAVLRSMSFQRKLSPRDYVDIRRIARETNRTQRDIANEYNISHQMVSKIISGERPRG